MPQIPTKAYSNFNDWFSNLYNSFLSGQKTHPILSQAILYSGIGGKYVRAKLCFAIGEILEINHVSIIPLAIALESIHAYSLIHDDLPAIDNDDYRRGKFSCHKQFNEATAVLAGDALQSLAYQSICMSDTLSHAQITACLQELVTISGVQGMIYGQMLDLFPQDRSKEEQTYCHELKTAMLFNGCATLPLCLLDLRSPSLIKNSLVSFTKTFGLFYQTLDDFEDNASSDLIQEVEIQYGQVSEAYYQIGKNNSLIDSILAELHNKITCHRR
ncbi:MAG: polyprenyl synthetase family protein [Methylacidiphilales bacterium]|nr:polyprenyl synthetase family protein [Candidatus Methylacidiphilales bacterium]